jgi:hypothetical protein
MISGRLKAVLSEAEPALCATAFHADKRHQGEQKKNK